MATQIIDTFVVPADRVADHLSEEIGRRAEKAHCRIVALSVIPNAANGNGASGVAVVLVMEPSR